MKLNFIGIVKINMEFLWTQVVLLCCIIALMFLAIFCYLLSQKLEFRYSTGVLFWSLWKQKCFGFFDGNKWKFFPCCHYVFFDIVYQCRY